MPQEQKNNLIIFTGPSGVGKGTIVKQVFADLEDIEFSISCTTRAMRPGEVDKVNYFFKTKEEFEQMINDDALLEWAEFVGNFYGTPKEFVLDTLANGKDVFLEIEVQGALQVMKKFPEALSIFLVPPSIAELEKRLRTRATETEEVLQKRLKKASEEMKFIDEFDYVITNDNLERAIESVKLLILDARQNLMSH